MIPDFRAIIPAGGAGTRLWPLSRRGAPKFLRDFTGSGRSLLQATWDRLVPLAGPEGIVVVTGVDHLPDVAAGLPASAEIIAEPSPRDSMAAIGLATAIIAEREGDAIVGSFAADHAIASPHLFAEAVAEAVAAAREDYLVTISITPTWPSTAYGYIRVGEKIADSKARHVLEFVEKPAPKVAEAYLATGEYRWNAGMFCARATVLLNRLAEYRPALCEALRQIAAAWDTPDRERVMAERWAGLEAVAIDHAIAEPLAANGGVAVVPGDFTWDDVGDWDSVASLLPPMDDGVRRLGECGLVLVADSDGAMVASTTGRAVAIAGVPGAIVVDTGDALLVTTRSAAQRVKEFPARLAEEGQAGLL